MKVGIWVYALGTILTGMLNLAWGAFDASHQPITVLGKSIADSSILAYLVGLWLVTAGFLMLWPRLLRLGTLASAAAYVLFAALWLVRYYTGIHALGLRIDVLFGVTFGVAQQVMLLSLAILIYASTLSPASPMQSKAATTARWMLGLPPIVFGLFHFIGLRVFATIVPQWMPFPYFWAAITGAAFFLSGLAICAGIKDILAARLLALMLLLFEGFVEVPPIFTRLHNQSTWGAAVYNITAIGACWVFAEFVAHRAELKRTGTAKPVTLPHPDHATA